MANELAQDRATPRPEPEQPPESSGALDAVSILRTLVRLKDEKDQNGPTAFYREHKDRAWDEARRLLHRIDAGGRSDRT